MALTKSTLNIKDCYSSNFDRSVPFVTGPQRQQITVHNQRPVGKPDHLAKIGDPSEFDLRILREADISPMVRSGPDFRKMGNKLRATDHFPQQNS